MNFEAIQRAKEAFEQELRNHDDPLFKRVIVGTTFNVIGDKLTLVMSALSHCATSKITYSPAILVAHKILEDAEVPHRLYTYVNHPGKQIAGIHQGL